MISHENTINEEENVVDYSASLPSSNIDTNSLKARIFSITSLFALHSLILYLHKPRRSDKQWLSNTWLGPVDKPHDLIPDAIH